MGSDDNLEIVVEQACRVVAKGGVRSISVVASRPLGGEELWRLRGDAAAQGVSLTIDARGTVLLRTGLRFSIPAWRRVASAWSTRFTLPRAKPERSSKTEGTLR